MKLNALEFAVVNNPLRAAAQRWVETPLLLGDRGELRGRRVLEVGCGRGVGLEILASRGAATVSGFDLDPAMIALARTRVSVSGSGTHVYVGDATAISGRDGSFDAVVEYAILHHIPHWPEALGEIARVLRPGGTFYFEDLLRGFTTAWPVSALFDHPLQTQFEAGEFREAVEAHGLRVQAWYQLGGWAVLGRAVRL
jgi:ubiquinone/menaquinone biosynthesis C-methylase UbiE